MNCDSTVFLIVNDAAALDALSLSLRLGGFQVENYASGITFLSAYHGERSGCLVMDLYMPEMDGLDVRQELIKRKILIPIIFLIGYGIMSDSISPFKAEAVDFLEKPFTRAALFERVLNALSREYRIRSASATQRGDYIYREDDKCLCYQRFSLREWEIMALVMSGHSSRQIAQALKITPMTVDSLLVKLMKKMRATSLAELSVIFAMLDRDALQAALRYQNAKQSK